MDAGEAENEEVMVSNEQSSEDSSDSDDSDLVEDVSLEDMAAISKLETDLEANPNLYDVNLQYITVLRKNKMRARLKEARRSMQERFPLGEKLWLDWLEDECAEKRKDVEAILELFELAVKDYLSVQLWMQYLQFMGDQAASADFNKESLEAFRDVAERALTAGGIHLAAGAEIWKTYRGFEEKLAAEGLDGDKQVQRARSLFHRQLQVPLVGNSEVFVEYQHWEDAQKDSQGLPAHVQKGYEKAQAAVKLRQAHEDAVASDKEANADLLAAYMAYINLEEAHGDPGRVTVLYERAVAVFPVTHYLWLQYARYLETHIKLPVAIKSVYERAVRNCPWVGALWARGLWALERGGLSDEEHAAFHARALQAGLQSPEDYLEVQLARIDCLRRKGQAAYAKTKEAFEAAQELLSVYFPDWVDRSLQLTAYRADCALRLGDGIEEARAVWNAALKTAAGRYAETWAGFITMEKAEQNMHEARVLYKRAIGRKLEENGQAVLCEAWVRFEREHGNPEEQLHAELKCEPILAAAASAAAAAANEQAAAAAQAAAEKAPKLSPEEMKRLRQERDPNFKGRKDSAKAEADAAAMPPPPPPSRMPPKRKKGLGYQELPSAKRHKSQDVTGTDAATAPSGSADESTAPVAKADAQAVPMEVSFASAGAQDVKSINDSGETMAATSASPQETQVNGGEGPSGPSGRPSAAEQQFYKDNCTAFLKNLPFKTEEEQVEKFFADCGGTKAVRLLRGPDGRAKGLAYVEFPDKDSLEKAVAKNGVEFQGRMLSIEVSRPPPADKAPRGGGGRGFRGGRAPGRGEYAGGRGEGGRGRGDGAFAGRGAPRGRGWGDRGGRGMGIRDDRVVGPTPSKLPPYHAKIVDLSGEGGQRLRRQAEKNGDTAPKSNADFRAMFLPRNVQKE
ncbi:Squamous cell carcinoma antigen recognized by T-cells 3 [Coccomyxa sp. Obi]|nr:Squamous cell carcinoma antigen recognized by T-cells 3 [Coccomyxa sp. Obi]